MAANKTDANDADGLAYLAEFGFYREVRVKGFDSMLTRTLVAARTGLVRIKTDLSNQVRGMMKTFGLIVLAGKGITFEAMFALYWPTAPNSLRSCILCSRFGGTYACELLNAADNLSPMPARAKHASY